MATATKTTTKARTFLSVRERSIALCEHYGMTAGAARFYVGCADGSELFRVTSRTSSTIAYEVRAVAGRPVSCACQHTHVALDWSKPERACWHKGAVALWLARRAAYCASRAKFEAGWL